MRSRFWKDQRGWRRCPVRRCYAQTTTEIKHWVELFFGVKVIAMNSHRLRGKARRMGPIMGQTIHYRRMIITLQPGYSIRPLRKKIT
ncbi:putative ribosomal protein L25/L23 [Helianthus anomalus]